jgi:beta-phosphoglucomutase
MQTYQDLAVLWDMDGVLVDSGPLHRRAWRMFLERKGLPITDAIFTLGFGRPNDQVLPEFFGDQLSAAEIVRLSDEKDACYRELVMQEGIPIVPGVLAWMDRFGQAGIRQALATSGCRANAELIVDLVGARPYLQVMVTARDVTRGKPYPDLFLQAAALLDVSPSRCLVIEDSLHGIRAAQAAQMRCLALATTHPADQISGCGMVIEDMDAFSWEAWERLFAAAPLFSSQT